MGFRTYMLTVSLLLALTSSPLQGQGMSKEENRLLQQELKLAQKTEEDRQRRDEIRVKIQPSVDQIGISLSRMEYRDQLAGAYLNSLGQSMVPKKLMRRCHSRSVRCTTPNLMPWRYPMAGSS